MDEIISNENESESSDGSNDKLEDTDFDNTEPQPINDINDEINVENLCMDIDITESDGDTPEHPKCNKEPKVLHSTNFIAL